MLSASWAATSPAAPADAPSVGALARKGRSGSRFFNHAPGTRRHVRRFAHALARRAPAVVGSAGAFLVLVAATLVWIAVGPAAGFGDDWLLVPSAVASIVALLLVVLLQYSQNRDTRALQLKLDEVIRAVGEARTELLQLERRSDEELSEIAEEFERLREDEGGR